MTNTALTNHIKENSTDDLATIHGVSVTTQRMISNSTTRLYLDATGLLLPVVDIAAGNLDEPILVDGTPTGKFTPHLAKATCLLIVKTLEGSSKDDDDFNFMVGNVKGDGVIAKTKELRDVTLTEYSTQIDAFLSISMNHCNSTTYPFSEVTQEELDAVKLELSLYVETAPLKVGYPMLDSAVDYAVVLSNRSVQFSVVLAAPAPVDLVVEVFVHTDYSETKTFDSIGLKVGFIRIVAGETNGSIIVKKPLSSKIQASAKCNVSGDYNLIVKAG